MKTIRIEAGRCQMIAHRGVSGLEKENTCAAFVVAGVKSYFGIETDVHVTADGHYIISHDSNLERVSGVNLEIEKSPFDLLQQVPLLDTDGTTTRSDLRPPALEDYIQICRKYGKTAILELKNLIEEKHVAGIVETIKELGHLEKTVFISFCPENLVCLRHLLPKQPAQFLVGEVKEETYAFLSKYNLGLDAHWGAVTAEVVERVHGLGLPVNCWTVDNPDDAKRLVGLGVDYITSNILE